MNSNSNSGQSASPLVISGIVPLPLPVPLSSSSNLSSTALFHGLLANLPVIAPTVLSPSTEEEEKTDPRFVTPLRRAKRQHEGPVIDDFFQGSDKKSYADFLEFIGSEHSEVLNTVKRLGKSITGSPEQNLVKLFSGSNLNLSKEAAIYVNLESAEDKSELATEAANIFLQDFLANSDNLKCVKQAYDDKKKDVLKECPEFVELLDKFLKADIKKILVNICSDSTSRNAKFDHSGIIGATNFTRLKTLSTQLHQMVDELILLEKAQRLRNKQEYILFEKSIKEVLTYLLDVIKFIESQSAVENIEAVKAEMIEKIKITISALNKSKAVLQNLTCKKNKKEKSEMYPSCMSFLVTKINGENHCYISLSSPEANAELLDALAKCTGKKQGWHFDLLATASQDSQKLLQSALRKLDQPSSDSPYKECSEKAYVNLLVKLILQYGDSIKIASVCNIMFYPNLHTEMQLNPNNQRINVKASEKNFCFELIPCCSACVMNKPAVLTILGTAVEFKRRADAIRQSLVMEDEFKSEPSKTSEEKAALSTPVNGFEISPLETSIHHNSASHQRVKGRRCQKLLFLGVSSSDTTERTDVNMTQRINSSANSLTTPLFPSFNS